MAFSCQTVPSRLRLPSTRHNSCSSSVISCCKSFCAWGWYSNKSRGLRKKAAQTAAAAIAPCSSLPAAELLQEPEDTSYRKACRRSWAQLIAKIYLVSPLVCPKCRGPMKVVSFIEDQAVVRKILQHLGIWETPPRPPPKKIVPLSPAEPVVEDRLLWVADPVYSYDDPDPVYPD